MASGLAYTLVRGLTRTESTYTVVLSFHVVAATVAGLWMIPDFVLPPDDPPPDPDSGDVTPSGVE